MKTARNFCLLFFILSASGMAPAWYAKDGMSAIGLTILAVIFAVGYVLFDEPTAGD